MVTSSLQNMEELGSPKSISIDNKKSHQLAKNASKSYHTNADPHFEPGQLLQPNPAYCGGTGSFPRPGLVPQPGGFSHTVALVPRVPQHCPTTILYNSAQSPPLSSSTAQVQVPLNNNYHRLSDNEEEEKKDGIQKFRHSDIDFLLYFKAMCRPLVNGSASEAAMETLKRQTGMPDEVCLCYSGIPGAVYGVCARSNIAMGTWMGPYEGRYVALTEYGGEVDTTALWEIYDKNQVSHFIEGCTWMKYVQSARYWQEQNMAAVQHSGMVYYRVTRELLPGEELLVYYGDAYAHFMGIPITLKQVAIEDFHGNGISNSLTATQQEPSVVQPPAPNSVNYSISSLVHDQPTNDTIKLRSRTALPYRLGAGHPSPGHHGPNGALNKVKLGRDDRGPAGGNSSDWHLWKCGQCFKTFTQRILLQMHVCSQNPDRPYQCGHCTAAYGHASELRNHVVTHTSERPFRCGFCGRAFAGTTTLKNHMRTHTGERPFKCDKCNTLFAQSAQLSRHQKVPGECPEMPSDGKPHRTITSGANKTSLGSSSSTSSS